MDPERISDLIISDVVISTAGRDQGKLFYVIGTDPVYLILTNGKDRILDKPKRKRVSTYKRSFALRPESPKSSGWATRCSTANYEETWLISAGKCKETTWEVTNLAKDDVIEIEGIVVDALPNAMFTVDIGNGHTILAHISGKLRMNFIKILPGDKVTVQMSPYDLTQGRITWRSK